jgi:hypothetical protein
VILERSEVDAVALVLWNLKLRLQNGVNLEVALGVVESAARKLGGDPTKPLLGLGIPGSPPTLPVEVSVFNPDERALMVAAVGNYRVMAGELNASDDVPIEGVQLLMRHLDALIEIERKLSYG